MVQALRRIKVPVVRWPGGCFADEYHWRDGVGSRAQRPVSINANWGGVLESNAFGTHEFLDFVGQIGAEPYICGNVGSGSVREMAEWVEYITAGAGAEMARLRRENGREEPWKLPYFGIGNEAWGCGGQMRAEYYADLYRRYQTYVRNYADNRVARIACGANAADYRWTEVLMREAGSFMEGVSLHYYTVSGASWQQKGAATGFGEEEWFRTLHAALVMDELIRGHAAVMDRYDPDKRVGLIVDEWGAWYDVEDGTDQHFLYQQNSMRDAMVAGLTLNLFNVHCDRVRMANLAQTVNVLQSLVLTDGSAMVTTPTYHVFDLFKVHQDATHLTCSVESELCAAAGKTMPQIQASASRDREDRIHLTVCNTHPAAQADVFVRVEGNRIQGAEGTVLTGDAMDAHNTFEKPYRVVPQTFTAMRPEVRGLQAIMPPMSVVLLGIKTE